MIAFVVWVVIWGIGWAWGTTIALADRMDRTACTGNRGMGTVFEFEQSCRDSHPANCRVAVGRLRARNLSDGVAALWLGLAWPILILAHFAITGVKATPAEAERQLAEQRRRLDAQAAEIERLTAQIRRTT